MEPLGFIDDGYNESGTLNGVARLYPAVTFTWRPMLVEEVAAYYEQAGPLKGPQVRQLVAATLAGKLKSWDLKDASGAVLPIRRDTLLRLKDRLFNRLFSVVSGQEAPDAGPVKPPTETAADFEAVLKAAEEGRAPSEVREEADRKN